MSGETHELRGSLVLGQAAGRLLVGGGVAGLACLGGAWALAAGRPDGVRDFLHGYLTAYMFFLSLSLGALFFVLLQHLTRAGWSVVVRRMAELLAAILPFWFLVGAPLFFLVLHGDDRLYPWVGGEDLTGFRRGWLEPRFFVVRCAVNFVAWSWMARYYLVRSQAQDATGDPRETRRMERVSGVAMVVYAFTVTCGAFDLVMSLSPGWFSTIFGVYFFTGGVVGALALLTCVALICARLGQWKEVVTVEHYHDLGKLLFAFVFFWGYIAFSQMMLQWYGNLPEETPFFRLRWTGEWRGISLLLLFGHFVIPFAALLPREAKRRVGVLAFWCVWMLVFHAVDVYWVVMPQLALREGGGVIENSGRAGFSLVDAGCLVGLAGFYLGACGWLSRRCNLVPIRDPRLGESLRFENV